MRGGHERKGEGGKERNDVLREHIRGQLAHVLSLPPYDDDHHDQKQCKNHQNSNDDGCYLTWDRGCSTSKLGGVHLR